MKTILDRLEKQLFGNGQPGMLDKLTGRVNRLEKWFFIATGAVFTMQFLSGSGVISLKALIGK